MKVEIIFEDDTELAEFEALNKCSCTVKKQATENKIDRQHHTIPN